MAASRTYLIVEYRHPDGEFHLNETHAFGTMAELVSNAPSFDWDIASVTRLTISAAGIASEDASAEVAKAVIERYEDDEDGIPDDWSMLFSRVGRDVSEENEISADERRALDRRYADDCADYRARAF